MGKIFVFITQLRNLTNRRLGFRFSYDVYCPLPDLLPGKTRKFKQSRILRCARERVSPPWTVLVLVDDSFTGIELYPSVILDYARIVFKYVTNEDGLEVLRVEGVPENCSDFLLRLKYFGFMRDVFWDGRVSVEIPPAESRVAKKLRTYASPMRKSVDSVTTTPPAKPRGKTPPSLPSPAPPPPPPPPPPSSLPPLQPLRMMRDGMEDTSTDTNSDDSSLVEESDHESSTSSSDIGEKVVHSSRVHDQMKGRVSNIHGIQQMLRGRREQWGDHDRGLYMDSFEFVVLFIIALALVWCLPRFVLASVSII